jgi:type I restriction enzyme S subunit
LLSHFGNSLGQQYFLASGKQTTNLASINLTQLGRLPVAVAPPREQPELHRRISHALALVTSVAVQSPVSAGQVAELERALLAKAFSGELVT